MARSVIKDCIQSDTFKNHYLSGNKQYNNYLPIVLITSNKLKEKLKLDNNTSINYTSEKGRAKHKDIKQEDYLLVQEIIDNGEIIDDRKPNHWIAYSNYDKEYNLKAVIKKTVKNEIYLQTLFKILKSRK